MRAYTRHVTALGDLLEAVHGAHRSLRPVQGTLREWRDERLVGRLEHDYWSLEVGEGSLSAARGRVRAADRLQARATRPRSRRDASSRRQAGFHRRV